MYVDECLHAARQQYTAAGLQPRTSMVASLVAASYLEDDAVKLLPTASCSLLLLTTYLEDDAVYVGRAEAAPMLL